MTRWWWGWEVEVVGLSIGHLGSCMSNDGCFKKLMFCVVDAVA